MAEVSADFELGTNGNNVLTTDAGSATAWNTRNVAAGTLTYDTTHVGHGTLAAKIAPSGASACYVQWDTAFGTQTEHYGRAYLYLTTNPSAVPRGPIRGYNGATVAWGIHVNTNGTLQCGDSDSSVSGSVAIGLNQLIRVEWHVVHSATVGIVEAKLFNSAESTTPSETITHSSANTLTQSDRIRFGVTDGGTAPAAFWIDDIIANATAYPGPVPSLTTFLPFQPSGAVRW